MDASQVLVSGLIALAFTAVHLLGERMRFLDVTPRSRWLSIAGGTSVAYVFVHLLPELEHYRTTLQEHLGVEAIEQQIYLVALVGLTVFYGLERLVRARPTARPGETSHVSVRGVFWLHIGVFGLYNLLAAYVLLHREDDSLRGLVLYGVAMSMHFLVNDRGLAAHHRQRYVHSGRWVLAATPLAGWAVGLGIDVPPSATSVLFALLAGSVILNVLKEELPEDRQSRFSAFVLGAAGYTGLLLIL